MKRSSLLFAVLLLTLTVVLMTACSTDDTTTTSSQTNTTTTTSSQTTITEPPAYGVRYRISYMDVDGTEFAYRNSDDGASVTAPAYNKDDRIFLGWYTMPNGEGLPCERSREYTSDFTYYAHVKYEAKLTFVIDDELIDEIFVPVGQAPGRDVQAPDRSANRLVFDQWKQTKPVGIKGTYDPDAPVYADAVYTGIYNQYYRLRFFEGSTLIAEQIVKEGTVYAAPAHTPATTGYIFGGWWTEDGAVEYVSGTGVAAEHDYYALYSKIHTVTFVDDAGTVMSTQQIVDGQNAELPVSRSDAYYYSYSPVDAHQNIRRDTTVTMTRVSKSSYYKRELSHSNMACVGNYRWYGTVLYEIGDYVEFSITGAGGYLSLSLAPNAALLTSITFHFTVYIDGHAMETFTVTGGQARNDNKAVCYIPADGQTHTIRIQVTDIPAAPNGVAGWEGIEIYGASYYKK